MWFPHVQCQLTDLFGCDLPDLPEVRIGRVWATALLQLSKLPNQATANVGYLFSGGFIEGRNVIPLNFSLLAMQSEGEIRCEDEEKSLHITACPGSPILFDPLQVLLVAEACSLGLKLRR